MPLPLELSGIAVRFGDVVALDDASLRVRPGTVHALLGENGAGKSTLMRVAFGLQHPDAGVLRRHGLPVARGTPGEAIAAGLGMVHQHFSLVAGMTVAENVALGGRGRFRPADARASVRRIAQRTGLALDPDARVGDLPVSAQQRVEIAKALARDARLLILDEPTAVLAPADAVELLRWVRRFADDGGSVVLITHKLRDALAHADDVTVLRRGRVMLAEPAAAITEPRLLEAMLGEPMLGARSAGGDVAPELVGLATDRRRGAPTIAPDATAPPVIRARDLALDDERGVRRIEGATFEIHGGEIVGVAAVEGAGQRELLRAIAGRLAPAAGVVERPDRVGFVPEDRHADAVILDMTLAENVLLARAGALRGTLDRSTTAVETAELMAAHDVRAPGPRAAMATLSGGNQQKLVVGRELATATRALVVENPTRGLDVRAAAAVLYRLRDARRRGLAVVCHSSDLDEVLAVADRVLVVHAGRVRSMPADRDIVGRAMLGAG